MICNSFLRKITQVFLENLLSGRNSNLLVAASEVSRKRLLIARTFLIPAFYINSGQNFGSNLDLFFCQFKTTSHMKSSPFVKSMFRVMEDQCSGAKVLLAKMWSLEANFVPWPNHFCSRIVQQLIQ